MDNLIKDLHCPITLELFEDPVSVPCCGKAFSRAALVAHIDERSDSDELPKCPLCNADISGFDARNAAKNVVIAGMVETIALGRTHQPTTTTTTTTTTTATVKDHRWSCSLTPITKTAGASGTPVGELKLVLENAKFVTRPSLFVAVVDESGSMGGRPMDQVRMALTHIKELAGLNEQVKLVIISYSSGAVEIQNVAEYGQRSSGTNFRAAFNKVEEVLRRYTCSDRKEDLDRPNNVSTVTIAFMTDGQDGSGNRERLVPEFREMLKARWGENPISVHAVGFSQAIDRVLLESMCKAGNTEGMFRFADQSDDGDALCNKLTGIFEVSSKTSSVPVDLTVDGVCTHIRFPVDARKYGEYRQWIQISDAEKPPKLIINSSFDSNLDVPVTIEPPRADTFQRWLNKCVDDLATHLLAMSNDQTLTSSNLRTLQCSLLEQRIDTLRLNADSDSLKDRLEFMRSQIDGFRAGTAINLAKLSDMRFGSLFGPDRRGNDEAIQIRTLPPEEVKALPSKPYNEQPLRCYSRNNSGKGRNELQEEIMGVSYDTCTSKIHNMLATGQVSDVLATDQDGNNSLMLAAYCGHSTIVDAILRRFPQVVSELELENHDGETAVTLAIKKRGFYNTLARLLESGAKIPRHKSIERFAIQNNYPRTAKLIAQHGDGSLEVNTTMTPDYVKFVYERAVTQDEKKWDKNLFLNVALAKNLPGMVEDLLRRGAQPTIRMLTEHCLPPKPDHPKTDEYLTLAKLVLDHSPKLILEKTQPELESCLLVAASKGSLPHVKYFISLGAEIEAQNEKGNTPLWVASFMRYPCIMTELMNRGANVNHVNVKGNNPLYGACCRGPPKIAEQLIARGTRVDHVNSNGDTLLLLCCRNGTHEVLQLLLNYVDEDFVNFKAHIDGFNAVMASAEQDRPDCIRVLQEYGVDLDQKTDEDNKILASATPLHIASYYGRAKATQMLLQLGANPNVKDKNGATPLHIAVVQGHIDVIKLLRDKGVDQTVEDNMGNTALAYCRDRADIRKLLEHPLLTPLMHLAQGGYTKEEEKKALQILKEYAGTPGIVTAARSLDVRDNNGMSPLIQAVIHGQRDIAQALVQLGVDVLAQDTKGIRAVFWAMWSKNARIIRLLEGDDKNEDEVQQQLSRLEKAAQEPTAAEILFLGQPPAFNSAGPMSTITYRMGQFINAPCSVEFLTQKFAQSVPLIQASNTQVVTYFNEKDLVEIQNTRMIWCGKIATIRHIASGSSNLGPPELMAIYMFTCNAKVSEVLNTQLLRQEFTSTMVRDYTGILYQGLLKLPKFTGEVYIGSGDADRKLFLKNREFTWNRFVSGSLLWKIALENAPSFTTKSRKGTVFILKSKTGRYVGGYSEFSFDGEVIFLPNTRFRVTNWYHGDVIALGQENIREHTFGIKETDSERMNLQEMIHSDKSLIIELTEVEETR